MNREPKTLVESLQEIIDNLDNLVRAQASLALLLKARYDALTKVGFTKAEALEIIKARGMNA